jgi:hypothetical protein
MFCKRQQRPQRYIIGSLYNIWTENAHENTTSYGRQVPVYLAGAG